MAELPYTPITDEELEEALNRQYTAWQRGDQVALGLINDTLYRSYRARQALETETGEELTEPTHVALSLSERYDDAVARQRAASNVGDKKAYDRATKELSEIEKASRERPDPT